MFKVSEVNKMLECIKKRITKIDWKISDLGLQLHDQLRSLAEDVYPLKSDIDLEANFNPVMMARSAIAGKQEDLKIQQNILKVLQDLYDETVSCEQCRNHCSNYGDGGVCNEYCDDHSHFEEKTNA